MNHVPTPAAFVILPRASQPTRAVALLGRARRAVACVLVLAGLIAGLTAPSPANAQFVMKLGTATINDSQHEWMKIFAAKVATASAGKIKVEIYPASQLGAIPRMIEGTQFNSVQGFVGPPEFLSGIDTRFEVLTAPGVFKDMAHFSRTLADPAFKTAFYEVGQQKGLKTIGIYPSGPLAAASRKPIEKLADLKGLKLRILASPLQIEQARKLGATGVPMSLGDVMPAIQQGTIDGTFSALPVLTALKFYGSAPYALETGQAYVSVITIISKVWFDGLPPDLQKVVVDAGQATGDEVSGWAGDYLDAQRKGWTDNGGRFIAMPAAERAEMMASMLQIGPEVMKTRPESRSLYELLVKTAKAHE